MSEPIIGYHSVITAANITASSEVAGFPASALGNPLTYDKWVGASSFEYLYIDAGSPVSANYIGIAAHTVEELTIATSPDGETWTDVAGPFLTTPGESQLFSFDTLTSQYWRIAVLSSSAYDTSVGALFLGVSLAMERCIMSAYEPLPYNRSTDFTPNVSDNGQFLGRSIIRTGLESSVEFTMITAPWARQYFQPFVLHARTKPYFFQWNPSLYPNEVAYVWTNEDIGIRYTRDRNLMSASWPMTGLESV